MYRDEPDKKPQKAAEFGFISDNPDGIALGTILTNGICSNDKLAEYAKERIERFEEENETKKKIEQLKKDLFGNESKKIKNIIQKNLLDEGYEEVVVLGALNDITIKIETDGISPPPPDNLEKLTETYCQWLKEKNTGYKVWIYKKTMLVIDIQRNGQKYAIDIFFTKCCAHAELAVLEQSI